MKNHKISTSVLVACIFIVGLLPMIPVLVSDSAPNFKKLGAVPGLLTSFIWGFTGVVIVLRKEYPAFVTLRGCPAVLIGAIGTVVAWGFALLFLLYVLFG